MAVAAIHLIIHGRVQGVGYRSWTRGRAIANNLTGWVRNRTDGTVEAVLCGEANALSHMQEECKKGPLAARVASIDASDWQGAIPIDFKQLPTA